MESKPATDEGAVRYVVDERLDFNHFVPIRKSYIVASSYRSGSHYLYWRLWQTGLLGAPSEVLNPTSELRALMNRFKTSSPAEYIATLLARRTSRNGVFGIGAHSHHFEAFLKEYPELLEVLEPLTYIYMIRDDKVAQAVSMAKALQTDAWTSRMEEGPKPVLRYDRDMIAHCLADIEQQNLTWQRWFEAHGVTPFLVTYQQLTTDADAVVRSIVELFGVENDVPDEVDIPPAKRQGDETNQEWIERFRREVQAGKQCGTNEAGIGDEVTGEEAPLVPSDNGLHFFDRYSRLIKSIPARGATATNFFDVLRLRRQYDNIVARNGDLFRNARVLDIMGAYGFWSLSALDAGASYVVGVDSSPKPLEAAQKIFNDYKINPVSYRFISSEILDSMRMFDPKTFDLILCHGFFELCDVREFFHCLRDLQPKRVILDTAVTFGEGPLLRFVAEVNYAEMGNRIFGVPSHALIMFLCDVFGFRWRLLDWRAWDIGDWTGIHDYERDQRRTYILDAM